MRTEKAQYDFPIDLCPEMWVKIFSFATYQTLCHFSGATKETNFIASQVIQLSSREKREQWRNELPNNPIELPEWLSNRVDLSLKRLNANFLERVKMEYFTGSPWYMKQATLYGAKAIGYFNLHMLYRGVSYFDGVIADSLSTLVYYTQFICIPLTVWATYYDEHDMIHRVLGLADESKEFKDWVRPVLKRKAKEGNLTPKKIFAQFSFIHHMKRLTQDADQPPADAQSDRRIEHLSNALEYKFIKTM